MRNRNLRALLDKVGARSTKLGPNGELPLMGGGANTFITPSVIAKVGLATLYDTTVLAALVWRDFDGEFTADVGDTISIRKPATFVAEKFNRTAGTTIQDATEDKVALTLDQIANVSFAVNDEDLSLRVSDFRAQLLDPALEAIIQQVEIDVAEALIDAAEGAGGGGTVTMAAVASDVVRKARRVLSRNLLPQTNRRIVFSPEGSEVALGDTLFVEAQKSGSTQALREANLGRVFGFDSYEATQFGVGPGDRGQADGVAFHQSALALAIRPLMKPKGVAAENAAVESYKQLSIRVVYTYNANKKRDEVAVDLLYGLKATQPKAAVQLNLGLGS